MRRPKCHQETDVDNNQTDGKSKDGKTENEVPDVIKKTDANSNDAKIKNKNPDNNSIAKITQSGIKPIQFTASKLVENGPIIQGVQSKEIGMLQSITCMEEHERKSFEELHWGDLCEGRKQLSSKDHLKGDGKYDAELEERCSADSSKNSEASGDSEESASSEGSEESESSEGSRDSEESESSEGSEDSEESESSEGSGDSEESESSEGFGDCENSEDIEWTHFLVGTLHTPYRPTLCYRDVLQGVPQIQDNMCGRFESITCMKEYKDISFEELRWEDLKAARKGRSEGNRAVEVTEDAKPFEHTVEEETGPCQISDDDVDVQNKVGQLDSSSILMQKTVAEELHISEPNHESEKDGLAVTSVLAICESSVLVKEKTGVDCEVSGLLNAAEVSDERPLQVDKIISIRPRLKGAKRV